MKSPTSAGCINCLAKKWTKNNPKYDDALEMYLQGATYTEIAKFLGVSKTWACQKFGSLKFRKKADFVMGVYVGDRPLKEWELKELRKQFKYFNV